jgi:hypothetical protein
MVTNQSTALEPCFGIYNQLGVLTRPLTRASPVWGVEFGSDSEGERAWAKLKIKLQTRVRNGTKCCLHGCIQSKPWRLLN